MICMFSFWPFRRLDRKRRGVINPAMGNDVSRLILWEYLADEPLVSVWASLVLFCLEAKTKQNRPRLYFCLCVWRWKSVISLGLLLSLKNKKLVFILVGSMSLTTFCFEFSWGHITIGARLAFTHNWIFFKLYLIDLVVSDSLFKHNSLVKTMENQYFFPLVSLHKSTWYSR